ncbi:MAG: serine/threonine protein kinase [Planctomycetota bacterium]|nr:MAG: serine/threonine protein kinase [Planctomycetota bacterium]
MSYYKERLFSKIALRENLVTQAQMEECFEIFKQRRREGVLITIGQVMLERGYLSREEVERVLRKQSQTAKIQKDLLLGKLCVQNRFLTPEQLQECLSVLRGSPGSRLSKILMDKKYLTSDQLRKVLLEQREWIERNWGDFEVERDLLVLAREGEEGASEGSLGDGDVGELELRRERDARKETLLVGELALRRRLVSPEQLRVAMDRKEALKAEGMEKNLAQILEEEDYITREDRLILEQEVLISSPRRDLIKNFEILERLGRGAMGVVYKARDLSTDQVVALKVLLPRYSNDVKFYRRFMREGYIATTLDHPNIVKAYEVGISEEYVYFSMQYVEGETIQSLLDRQGCLSVDYALRVVIEIAKALECAWRHQLVHRDIKPDNIIITREGKVKLCDLGIAKEVAPGNPRFTPTDKIMGTPYYISPELVQGEEIDIRSDIYSLGASFYHMVVGKVPFDGESTPRIMVKHVLEALVPPHERKAGVPLEVSEVIMRMMAKRPDGRFQTPEQLRLELEGILGRFGEDRDE